MPYSRTNIPAARLPRKREFNILVSFGHGVGEDGEIQPYRADAVDRNTRKRLCDLIIVGVRSACVAILDGGRVGADDEIESAGGQCPGGYETDEVGRRLPVCGLVNH